MTTTYSYTVAFASLAATAALGASHFVSRVSARFLSLLAVVMAGAAIAASGHAASASLVARLALFVHAMCLVFWIGALLPLAALFATGGVDRTATLKRFSAAIPLPFAGLVISGLVLSGIQLTPLVSLLTSSYGHVLLLKLGLVAVLVSLAAYNRYRLTPRVTAVAVGGERSLNRSIGVELVLVLAILGAAGLWRFTPPPRAQAGVAPLLSIYIQGQEAAATVTLTRGRDVPRSMTIVLNRLDSRRLEAMSVRMTATHASAGIAPIHRGAEALGNGRWKIDGLILPRPGFWTISLDVQVGGLKSVRLEDRIEING
jgi:copper transport protein